MGKLASVESLVSQRIVMAALSGRCGHYIFVLWFLLSIFFLAYSQPLQIGCLPYLYTWCGVSAYL